MLAAQKNMHFVLLVTKTQKPKPEHNLLEMFHMFYKRPNRKLLLGSY